MTMQVRSGYVNPLTMTKENRLRLGHSSLQPKNQTDSVTQLQNKRQQLQNQMLLMKATGADSTGQSSEIQKKLEAKLETVSTELRTAKADYTQTTEQMRHTQPDTGTASARSSHDLYTPTKNDTASPGLYHIKKDAEKGYAVSFTPYSEK